jgi:hypothetical protein
MAQVGKAIYRNRFTPTKSCLIRNIHAILIEC